MSITGQPVFDACDQHSTQQLGAQRRMVSTWHKRALKEPAKRGPRAQRGRPFPRLGRHPWWPVVPSRCQFGTLSRNRVGSGAKPRREPFVSPRNIERIVFGLRHSPLGMIRRTVHGHAHLVCRPGDRGTAERGDNVLSIDLYEAFYTTTAMRRVGPDPFPGKARLVPSTLESEPRAGAPVPVGNRRAAPPYVRR